MKIKFIFILLLAIVISACQPQQVTAEAPIEAITTEETQTAVPAEIEQLSGTVFFNIDYTPDIPREYFDGTDVVFEAVSFEKVEGVWQEETLTPKYRDLGPLFMMYLYEELYTTNGSCGINVTNISSEITVQPICNVIESETTAHFTLGILDCNKQDDGSLFCIKAGQYGNLRYTLNKNRNKFQFVVEGAYDFAYEGQIRETLKKLGFEDPSSDYFDGIVPGKNNTIYKNPSEN